MTKGSGFRWALLVLAAWAFCLAGCDQVLGAGASKAKDTATKAEDTASTSATEEADAPAKGGQLGDASGAKPSSDEEKPKQDASKPPEGEDAQGDAPPPAASKTIFEDPKPAIDGLKAKVGGSPVKALHLWVYPGYIKMQAQDPNKKENVDEYRFNGSVEDPTPVRLLGKPDQAKLEKNLFSLDDVDFSKLPGLIADAKTRLPYDGAVVSHVIIQRVLPLHQDVRFRVYVRGPRRSGSVEYNLTGEVTKVHE